MELPGRITGFRLVGSLGAPTFGRCSIDCALAMCDKVVDIWFKRVTKIIVSLNKDEPVPAAMSLEQPQILGE